MGDCFIEKSSTFTFLGVCILIVILLMLGALIYVIVRLSDVDNTIRNVKSRAEDISDIIDDLELDDIKSDIKNKIDVKVDLLLENLKTYISLKFAEFEFGGIGDREGVAEKLREICAGPGGRFLPFCENINR